MWHGIWRTQTYCFQDSVVGPYSILVQMGQTLQSSFPDLPKGLEEKGLKKMARAFLRGAQWPCPGICLSPAPSGVQEVSSENELLN